MAASQSNDKLIWFFIGALVALVLRELFPDILSSNVTLRSPFVYPGPGQ